jgi:uncharacterized repeat protein (TIGR01451 family)
MSTTFLFNQKTTILTGLIIIFSLFLSSLPLIPKTFASSYVVTTNADSGTGSLRDAMDQAVANIGPDTITFNLPIGQTLIEPLSPLPTMYQESLIIDATTQPGYIDSPIVEISGINAGLGTHGLLFTGEHTSGSVIKGLSITNFSGFGIYFQAYTILPQQHIIEGNYIGVKPDGITAGANFEGGLIIAGTENVQIGGLGKSNRNVISGNENNGIYIYNTIDSIIENNYIGTDATGTLAIPNLVHGIKVFGEGEGAPDPLMSKNNIIGLNVSGGGNVISGNGGNGIYAQASTNLAIQNNTIGLDIAQNNKLPNGTIANAGIYLNDMVSDFRIGGTNLNESNIISGNIGNGMYIFGEQSSNSTIQNNIIGSNKSGAANLGNAINGILIYNAQNILIGGIGPSTGNTIANNGKHGVSVEEGVSIATPPQNITILGNSIRNNTNLGINLENIAENTNFIDPNDILDVDAGPNNLQNYPLITTQTINSTDITLSGTLNSEANIKYRIEIFATNPTFVDTTDREGNEFLGFTQITTDGSGNASWSINIPLSYLGYTYSVNATRYTIEPPLSTGLDIKPFNNIGSNKYFDTSEFNARNFAVPTSTTPTPSNNLSVQSDKPQLISGDNLTYNIVFTNNGSVVLTGVQVQTILDPNLEFVSCSNSCSQSGQILTWNIASMNIGQNNTNILVVRAKSAFNGNVTTTSNLTAIELPLAKTQSITTPVSSISQIVNLPRTGGQNTQFLFIYILSILLGIFLLSGSVKSYRKKIPVIEVK